MAPLACGNGSPPLSLMQRKRRRTPSNSGLRKAPVSEGECPLLGLMHSRVAVEARDMHADSDGAPALSGIPYRPSQSAPLHHPALTPCGPTCIAAEQLCLALLAPCWPQRHCTLAGTQHP
jgi:hypothetical protein